MGRAARLHEGQHLPQRRAAPPLGQLAKWRNQPNTYIACLDGRTAYRVSPTGQFRRVARLPAALLVPTLPTQV
jgi:hypothetical protein